MGIFSESIKLSKNSLEDLFNKALSKEPSSFEYKNVDLLDTVFKYAFGIKEFWAICLLVDSFPLIIYLLLVLFKENLLLRRELVEDSA
tara:strand:+ start:1044 stop:1307 length:264 start_codon:yes stop_codon:yes gene_type:complete